MVTGQTQNLWKLKDLGGIVTKENVVREGPGRYGSEVYHGTSHIRGVSQSGCVGLGGVGLGGAGSGGERTSWVQSAASANVALPYSG